MMYQNPKDMDLGDLQAEVTYWRDIMEPIQDGPNIKRLCRKLGLYPAPTKVMLRLYRARGSVLPAWAFEEQLPTLRDDQREVLKVAVYNIRRAIGYDCIGTISGKYCEGGYWLTEQGRRLVRDLLEEEDIRL